nr:hypothetical protein GCM10020092_027520 [Actinoplanes digitatis]
MLTGRVCGTAIGMALSPTVSFTPKRSIRAVTAPMKRSHCRSGSGSTEQQERRPELVAHEVQRQARLLVALPVVLDEDHRRSAGAVVEQLVDVEGREDPGVELVQQVFAGKLNRTPGVDEAGECLQKHRGVQLRQVVGQLVEPVWVEHALDLLRMRPRRGGQCGVNTGARTLIPAVRAPTRYR